MLRIIVDGDRYNRFQAVLEGIPLLPRRSATPLFTAARRLLESGTAPETRLAMRHAGARFDAMVMSVGEAAGLTVGEGHHAPRFLPYREFAFDEQPHAEA